MCLRANTSRITSYNVCYTKLLRLITTINKSAERLLQLHPDEIVGHNYRDLLTPDHLPIVRDLLRDLLGSGKDTVRRQVSIDLGENHLTLLVNVTTLKDEQQEFISYNFV